MAKKVNITAPEGDPLVTLTDEAREHIENLEPEINRAYGDIEAMESLGMDASRLREKVDWAKKAREVILDRLSK